MLLKKPVIGVMPLWDEQKNSIWHEGLGVGRGFGLSC